jgi:ribosomal protein S17
MLQKKEGDTITITSTRPLTDGDVAVILSAK